MHKYKNAKGVVFDIEATGLSGVDNEFYLATAYDGNKIKVFRSLAELSETFNDHFNWDKNFIITYNGQNYRGGYDLPFLRTQFALNDMKWPFNDYWHIDFLPIIRRFIDTNKNEVEIDSVSKMYKADLVRLCEVNGIEYQSSKQETYDQLMEMEDVDWLDHKKENSNEYNDLQTVYQIFFDPQKEEEYIPGEEIPEIIEKERKTDIGLMSPSLVAEHCERDVKRLFKVFSKLEPYLASEYIHKHFERL